MVQFLKRFLRHMALAHGRFRWAYIKLCKPNSDEWASYLKKYGKLHALGENCRINVHANITDPAYVKIGNNVTLSNCNLIGHDGTVAMLNNAYDVKLDSVGKIVIHDNVFIGHGAIVLPNVTVGPNAVVAAGAVVNRDVLPGDIVAGVPAKPVGRVDDLVEKLKTRTAELPWAHLIEQRKNAFDPVLEAELVKMRVKYFYPEDFN